MELRTISDPEGFNAVGYDGGNTLIAFVHGTDGLFFIEAGPSGLVWTLEESVQLRDALNEFIEEESK